MMSNKGGYGGQTPGGLRGAPSRAGGCFALREDQCAGQDDH